MSIAGEIQEQQRQTWDRFSGGWTKWDDMVLTWLQPAGDEIIRSLELGDDGEHLDVAAGTGEPGLSIAGLLARGRVILTHVSAGMLPPAPPKAPARGLAKAGTRGWGGPAPPLSEPGVHTPT